MNPPDPVGEVGPNNYVEMVEPDLRRVRQDRQQAARTRRHGHALEQTSRCRTAPTRRATRSSSTTSSPTAGSSRSSRRAGSTTRRKPFWNCVAVSTTSDPTGSYYRYAFETANFQFFPDYPKYGNWTDSYVLTTREFGPTVEYGIGVYALEKNKMVNGEPARAVSFFIDGNDPDLLPLVGDGLLPADVDGKQKPKTDAAIPIVGTQDDNADYGATFDALNIWDLDVKWKATPNASLTLNTQLPTAPFDSIFPCGPDSRDCLPQPGITESGAVPRHPFVPAAADVPARLPELQGSTSRW